MRAKWLGFVVCALTVGAYAAGPGPAESLYMRLRSVGLDSSRVYSIRHADLNRGSIHISLDDGTIGFTEDAGGHITGAVFQGDGEILVSPPNAVERASLALFTNAAILDERFSFAYFRFNDDVFGELKESFRPPEDSVAFVQEFNTVATSLAEGGALRLLLTFENRSADSSAEDHFLDAYIQGHRLGTFWARYDSRLPEPVSLGQPNKVRGTDFYDVWASFAVKKGPQDEADPDTGLLSTHDFDITQFTIRSEIRPPTEIRSTAVLSFAPRRSGTRVLVLELSRLLQVQSVEENGQPVEFIHNPATEGSRLAKRGNDWLVVFLRAPVKVGETVQLKVAYAGSVLSESASGLLYVGEHGTWYPNIGFSISSFDLEFRYPVGWTLVSVGRLAGLKSDGDEKVAHWITERKIPVAGFNLGKYSHVETQAAGVRVETYATSSVEKALVARDEPPPLPDVLPRRPGMPAPQLMPSRPPTPSPSRNLQFVSSMAGQAVEYYSRQFGPYPYSELMLTQVPGVTSQGWPGLIFLSSYAFLSSEELEQVVHDPVERIAARQLVAHEAAHQWWGDLVTFSGYRDQWMMEALANYSSMMLLESKDPVEFRKLMQRYRDNLLVKGADDKRLMDAGPVTLGLRLSSSKFPNAYEAISYGRGTWLFHMLRTMMRDAERGSSAQTSKNTEEPFVRALRELRRQYEGRSVTTADLLAVFETQLPKSLWYEGKHSLDWFVESWLDGTAVPSFELRSVKVLNKQGSCVVTGTIVQEHAPDTLVTPVPLYAVVGTKPIFLRRVFADGGETSFRITAPAGTRRILLDPEQTLLSRAK